LNKVRNRKIRIGRTVVWTIFWVGVGRDFPFLLFCKEMRIIEISAVVKEL